MSLHDKTQEEEKIEPRLGDDIPEDWVKQATKELNSEYRTVNLESFRGEICDVHIHHPNSGIESEASDAYSKSFSKLLQDPDLMTTKQMEELIKDRGIWGDEQEEKINSLREDLLHIEKQVAYLRKAKASIASLDKLRTDWTAIRDEIRQIMTEKQNFLSNTVEGRANEHSMKVKLSLCVKFPDGTRVWDSVKELDKEPEKFVVVRLLYDAALFWAGFTQEIIDELPAKLIFGGEETLDVSEEN